MTNHGDASPDVDELLDFHGLGRVIPPDQLDNLIALDALPQPDVIDDGKGYWFAGDIGRWWANAGGEPFPYDLKHDGEPLIVGRLSAALFVHDLRDSTRRDLDSLDEATDIDDA